MCTVFPAVAAYNTNDHIKKAFRKAEADMLVKTGKYQSFSDADFQSARRTEVADIRNSFGPGPTNVTVASTPLMEQEEQPAFPGGFKRFSQMVAGNRSSVPSDDRPYHEM